MSSRVGVQPTAHTRHGTAITHVTCDVSAVQVHRTTRHVQAHVTAHTHDVARDRHGSTAPRTAHLFRQFSHRCLRLDCIRSLATCIEPKARRAPNSPTPQQGASERCDKRKRLRESTHAHILHRTAARALYASRGDDLKGRLKGRWPFEDASEPLLRIPIKVKRVGSALIGRADKSP